MRFNEREFAHHTIDIDSSISPAGVSFMPCAEADAACQGRTAHVAVRAGDTTRLAKPGRRRASAEQGLLGIAFHPNYQSNGKFYIAYSAPLRGDAPLEQSRRTIR